MCRISLSYIPQALSKRHEVSANPSREHRHRLEQEIQALKVIKCSSKLNSSRRKKQSPNPKLEKKLLEHKRQH